MNQNYKKEVNYYVETVLERFSKYQSVVLELFSFFHNFCIENEITYFCAYGTLLGLIRDGEMLPWDYDCDVMIFGSDLEKLLKSFDEKLPDDYYYVYNNNTKKYCAECIRLCKKGYSYMAFHIDIFLLIGAPNEKKKRENFKKGIYNIESAKISLFYPYHVDNSSMTRVQKLLRVFYKIKHLFLTEKRIHKKEIGFIKKYPIERAEYLCLIQPFMDEYKKEWFEKSIVLKNNDFEYCVPIGFKEILKAGYGDYENKPTIESSFDELYRSLNIIEKRQAFYKKQIEKCQNNKKEIQK